MPSRTDSRRNSTVPDFDPYGYSPYDPQYQDSKDDEKSSHKKERRSSSSKGKNADNDSDWDTDYDPRDKYYLSGDEGEEVDHRSPTGRSPTRKHSKHHSRDRDSERHSSHGHSHHSSAKSTHPSSQRPSHSRRESHDHSHHTDRSSSSRSSRPSRPRPVPRHSSYHSKPRSTKYPPSASRSTRSPNAPPAPIKNIPWDTVARCALQAGAITALKIHNQPGSLVDKGTRVATAALGAAVVDTLMQKREPKGIRKGGIRHAAVRQFTEVALGGLLVKPGVNAVRAGGRR